MSTSKKEEVAPDISEALAEANDVDNKTKANSVINNSMLWTGAAGIIPVPIVDTASIAALQLAMLSKIGKIYGYTFSSHWGKSTLASLTGGYLATSIGKGIGKRVLGGIPLIGPLLKVVVAPGFAAASTWAVGKIFIAHFEAGGTMLSFDPSKMKEHYTALVSSKLSPKK